MKLHLGCGKRFLQGYTHVDLADFEHIDYKIPVEDLSIFQDETIDLIYASHVLEYFDREQVESVLKEWRRVLKFGGKLRIAVPNFKNLIKVYETTGDIDKILGPLYGKWSISDSKSVYHKTVYDEKKLSDTLLSAGFKQVNFWDWQEVFKDLDFDDHSQAYYPHMDKKSGIHVSLNLECIK